MESLFWDNVRRLIGTETAQIDLARESEVSPTTINNGIANNSNPRLSTAYKIALALETSIEELHAGNDGAAFIRKLAKNDPLAIHVPDYMQAIVDNLRYLKDSEEELGYILTLVESIAAQKKKQKLGAG